MVTVDEYARIRLAHRDGMSIRAIARTFHHSRHKVRQILDNAEPRPYTRSQVAAAPVLGPFHGIIDEILKTDEEAPPKQRHTAMQLYRRRGWVILHENFVFPSTDPSSDKPFVIMGLRLPREPH